MRRTHLRHTSLEPASSLYSTVTAVHYAAGLARLAHDEKCFATAVAVECLITWLRAEWKLERSAMGATLRALQLCDAYRGSRYPFMPTVCANALAGGVRPVAISRFQLNHVHSVTILCASACACPCNRPTSSPLRKADRPGGINCFHQGSIELCHRMDDIHVTGSSWRIRVTLLMTAPAPRDGASLC